MSDMDLIEDIADIRTSGASRAEAIRIIMMRRRSRKTAKFGSKKRRLLRCKG